MKSLNDIHSWTYLGLVSIIFFIKIWTFLTQLDQESLKTHALNLVYNPQGATDKMKTAL